MSDVRDPQRDQQLPVDSGTPSCHEMVIEDLRYTSGAEDWEDLFHQLEVDLLERMVFGTQKYTLRLQPFNGRSFLKDAYEETLDQVVYLRGLMYEDRANLGRAREGLTRIYLNGLSSLYFLKQSMLEAEAPIQATPIEEFDPKDLLH